MSFLVKQRLLLNNTRYGPGTDNWVIDRLDRKTAAKLLELGVIEVEMVPSEPDAPAPKKSGGKQSAKSEASGDADGDSNPADGLPPDLNPQLSGGE